MSLKRSAAEVSYGLAIREEDQARKDSAVYVSLSSYALVKEHDGNHRSPIGFRHRATQKRDSPKRIWPYLLRAEKAEGTGAARRGTALVVRAI